MNSSYKHRSQVWAVFVSLAMSVGTARANPVTFIDTFSSWDGTSAFGDQLGQSTPGGPVAYATYGQTFTVPDNYPNLVGFSIWMANLTTTDPLIFGGYVMAWNGQRAVGPVLYQDGSYTLHKTGGDFWEDLNFAAVPNLELVPGQQYVFIFSASKFLDGLDRRGKISGLSVDAYPGGGAVYLDNGTDTSLWTTEDWTALPGSEDTVFWAEFASTQAVPDSANVDLLVISAAFLAAAGIRRKHAAARLLKNPLV